MANFARDIFFAVRVEDRATRPLRRIAADFAALGRQGLAMRQRDLQSAQRSYASARAGQQSTRNRYRDLVTQGKQITASKQVNLNESQLLKTSLQREGVLKNLPVLYQQENVLKQRAKAIDQAMVKRGPLAGSPLSDVQLAKSYEQTNLALENLKKQQVAYADTLGLTDIEMASQYRTMVAYDEEVNRLSASELKNAQATTVAEGRRAAAFQGMRVARKNLKDASDSLNRFPLDRLAGISRNLRHIGALLGTFGIAAVAAFGFAGKAAADFSTQATIAATQSTLAGHNTVAQVQKNSKFIQAEILKMMQAGQVTAAPKEQTAAAYEIYSGVTLKGGQTAQLKQGIALLKEFNKVTIANQGLVSLEEATNAGIIIMNRFGSSVADVPKKLNIMQAAVRYGKLTMSEFVGTLGVAAPAAQSAGYTFTQMSAAVAFLSRQFPNLRMGVTGYARLIEVLSRKDVVQALRAQGVEVTKNVNGVQKLLPLQQIATNIMQKFHGQVKTGSTFLQNFFKSIGATTAATFQARRVLVTYMQHLGGAGQILRQVSGDHNELAKSIKASQESPGVKFQEFVNQMKALGLTVGMGVLPALSDLTKDVKGVASWFNNLSTHTKHTIGTIAFLVGLTGLLGGAFMFLAGTIGGVVAALAGIKNVGSYLGLISKDAEKASGEVGKLSAEAGQARIGLAAGLGLVAAIPALVLFHKQITKVIGSIGGFKNALILLAAAASGLIFARLIQNISMLELSMGGLLRSFLLLSAAFMILKQGIGGADSLWRAWTHSTSSVVVGLVLMTGVVYKLITAIKTLLATEIAQKIASIGAAVTTASTATAAAGAASGLTSFVNKRGVTQYKDAAGKFAAAPAVAGAAVGAEEGAAAAGLGGITVAGMGLSVALPVVGATVAALAGGLYLLHRRADEAKKKAEELAIAQAKLNEVLNAGVTAANRFASSGQKYRQALQANLDLQDINRQISETRTQVNNAPAGPDRNDAQRQLNELLLQRGDILDRQRKSWKDYWNSAGGVGVAVRRQRGFDNEIQNIQQRIAKLKQLKNLVDNTTGGRLLNMPAPRMEALGLDPGKVTGVKQVEDAIHRAQNRLKQFQETSRVTAAVFRGSVRRMLESLQNAQLVPGSRVTQGMVRDVSEIMHKVHRMLTPNELNMIITAEIDPKKAPRGLSAWVRNFIRHRYRIRVDAVLNTRAALKKWAGFTKAIGMKIPGIDLPQPPKEHPHRPRVTHGEGAGGGGGIKDKRSVSQWINLIVQANKLAEKAPTVKNWQRYYGLQDKLSKAFSGNQLQAIQEVISSRENQTKTQQKYSDQFLMHEARNVHRLEKIAKKQNTLAAWKAYYNALATLQSRASDVQMQAIDQILGVTSSKVNAAANKAQQTVNTMLGNLQTMYNDFLQKNKEAFGTLFQGPFSQSSVMQDKMAYGYKMSAKDSLKDLRSQIKQFKEFNKELQLLQRKGAPPELIAQLRELGPSALPQIKTLEKASPKVWKEYLKAYKQSQKLIEQQTRRDLQNQLRIYRQQGKKIAMALLSGLQSQDKKLIRWLRSLIAGMFPGLAKQARQAQSPAGRRTQTQVTTTHHQIAPHRSTTRRQQNTRHRGPSQDTRRHKYQTAQFAMEAFAKGGIVTKPTIAMIGEAGYPEAVVPLRDPDTINRAKTGFKAAAGFAAPGNRGVYDVQTLIVNKLIIRNMPRDIPRDIPTRLPQLQPSRPIQPIVIKDLRRSERPMPANPPPTEKKVEYHDHFHITAPKGEEDSVLKQAKHAAWSARTRHRHT